MNYNFGVRIQKISILLFFILLTVSFPKTSYSSTWHFLKSISGVGVFFENLSRHKDQIELNEESLYINAVEILEKSNIKVYKDSQWKNNWGGAFLKIKIISSKFNEAEGLAVYIDASVYRPVVIFGGKINQNTSFNSTSWSTGKLFSCSQEEFQTCVQKGVNDLIELFVNDFKAVNGER
ncbi:MAG: hypothetical protein ACR2NW_08020 [Thermodesulfobacteriota bacterium]